MPSRKPIPAYNSCGLGLMDDLGALADEAETLLAVGNFRAVKLRLGYPTLGRDIAAVHAVRQRIGEDVALMVDYNQALAFEEALARGRALDAENIYWLEEPIRHDDYAGAARLAQANQDADPDRREFLAARGHGRSRSMPASGRLRDARPRTHRRRHRLAAGRANGRR